MTKANKIKLFDPNAPATENSNMYGLPFTADEADVVVLPLPWEVTVSYRAGTSKGPAAIYDASMQVDLYNPYQPEFWKKGIAMLPINKTWKKLSNENRKKAAKYIDFIYRNKPVEEQEKFNSILADVNKNSKIFHEEVYKEAKAWLKKGKMMVGLGGDHSTPFGIIKAYAEEYNDFGILHLDAHCDLRKAYEDFEYSHASIFYNVTAKIKKVKKIVQVGIRDYCKEEFEFILANKGKISFYPNHFIKNELHKGKSFQDICDRIIKELPKNVYISFDIDALDVRYCPNTGTPVPGGMDYDDALFLINKVAESGRKIVGFDVNEVSPGKDEWDANVGARLLYNIAAIATRK